MDNIFISMHNIVIPSARQLRLKGGKRVSNVGNLSAMARSDQRVGLR